MCVMYYGSWCVVIVCLRFVVSCVVSVNMCVYVVLVVILVSVVCIVCIVSMFVVSVVLMFEWLGGVFSFVCLVCVVNLVLNLYIVYGMLFVIGLLIISMFGLRLCVIV